MTGPSGILTPPSGVTLSREAVAEIHAQWDSAEGRIAILAAGWRFRQRLPDGTFEPEYPANWYEPQAILSTPESPWPLRAAVMAGAAGVTGAVAALIALVAVLAR